MAARVLAFYTFCILLLLGGVTATTSHKKPLHFSYFVHETRGGPNTTVISAAGTGQGNMSAVGWGTFLVIDNRMKSGSASDSLLWGSVTGTAVVTTAVRVVVGGIPMGSLQINTEHFFKEGSPYNGSSLTVIGTIWTTNQQSECIIPGGTGLLRGYSGYAILNPLPDAAAPPLYVFQWDVYITHKK